MVYDLGINWISFVYFEYVGENNDGFFLCVVE